MADVPAQAGGNRGHRPSLPTVAARAHLARLLTDARAEAVAVRTAREASRAKLKELGMPDFPDETPTEELDQEASIQTQLAAVRQELGRLPDTMALALGRHAWGFLIPYMVGTIMGALVGAGILLTAHYLYYSSPLDMKRHLWDVATPAEQEQILTILVRGNALLPRIVELAGPPPSPLDPPAAEELQ